MYQAAHPGRGVAPMDAANTFSGNHGGIDNVNSPLTPFRNADAAYFTSRELASASSVWAYGYAYPEVPASMAASTAAQLTAFVNTRINALYRSSTPRRLAKRGGGRRGPKLEWLCHFVFAPSEIGGTVQLEVYLSAKKDEDGVYVGSGAALAKSTYSDAEKAKKKMTTAVVSLTEALEDAGIDTGNKRAVARYLKDRLKWFMKIVGAPLVANKSSADILQDGNRVDISKYGTLKVGVSSSVVNYEVSDDKLPQWGKFETYYEITEQKTCGLKVKDSHLVDSVDAPKLLDGVSSALPLPALPTLLAKKIVAYATPATKCTSQKAAHATPPVHL